MPHDNRFCWGQASPSLSSSAPIIIRDNTFFFPSLFVLRKSFWAFCPPFPLLISSSNLTPSLGTSSTSFSPRWGYQGQARFIPDTSGSSFLDASVGLGSRFHFLAEDRHPVSPPLLRFSCFSPCGEVTQNWVAWYCRVPWE